MNKEDLIKLAFVAHPHGIKGEAELRLLNPEQILDDGMKVWLYPSSQKSKINEQGEEWGIQKIRYGNKTICQFEGVRDRTHLESLIPFEIYLAREDFPELEEEDFYLVDLIGMDVVNESGTTVGIVKDFADNGAQYLLDIRLATGEMMTLPFVENFFPDVNVEERKITMIMPEYTE